MSFQWLEILRDHRGLHYVFEAGLTYLLLKWQIMYADMVYDKIARAVVHKSPWMLKAGFAWTLKAMILASFTCLIASFIVSLIDFSCSWATSTCTRVLFSSRSRLLIDSATASCAACAIFVSLDALFYCSAF